MRFVLALCPPLVAGALLTLIFFRQDQTALIPGTWLLLYGTGVLTGGSASIRIVPLMGLCFVLLGGIALFSPPLWGDWLLAIGFGGVHLIFGSIISWRHGG